MVGYVEIGRVGVEGYGVGEGVEEVRRGGFVDFGIELGKGD